MNEDIIYFIIVSFRSFFSLCVESVEGVERKNKQSFPVLIITFPVKRLWVDQRRWEMIIYFLFQTFFKSFVRTTRVVMFLGCSRIWYTHYFLRALKDFSFLTMIK